MASKVVKHSKRPAAKLRQWSDESMLGAIRAVREGEFGVNRAALEYGVPRTTLKDRLSGRVTHGSQSGAKPYLSREEEKELFDFLITCSNLGYGKTRKEVMLLVEGIMKKKGRSLDKPISNGWWLRFLEWWPKLSLRKGDSFSVARDKMTSPEVFDGYFKLLKETLEKNDLMHKPSQIYNCDESGMPLEHKLPRTVSPKGVKKVRQGSRAKQAGKENNSKRVRAYAPTASSLASSSNSTTKQYPTRKKAKTVETAPKVSDDVCAVCTGAYVDESGDVTADWIQCADAACGVWSHVDCLEKHAAGHVCAICFSIFT